MRNARHYYASTSILACQIYGVISDIGAIAKAGNLIVNEKGKKLVSNRYNIKMEDIDKEKGRFVQSILFTQRGVIYWAAASEYLKEEILCSSDSKKRWESQPIRNKICHGSQLNFGTEEHSLKAILSIDMLIQLANEIEYVGAPYRSANNKSK